MSVNLQSKRAEIAQPVSPVDSKAVSEAVKPSEEMPAIDATKTAPNSEAIAQKEDDQKIQDVVKDTERLSIDKTEPEPVENKDASDKKEDVPVTEELPVEKKVEETLPAPDVVELLKEIEKCDDVSKEAEPSSKKRTIAEITPSEKVEEEKPEVSTKKLKIDDVVPKKLEEVPESKVSEPPKDQEPAEKKDESKEKDEQKTDMDKSSPSVMKDIPASKMASEAFLPVSDPEVKKDSHQDELEKAYMDNVQKDSEAEKKPSDVPE